MNIISAETRLLGVLGDPINHSLSPTIHNAALKAMDLNWTYLAIPCSTNNLELVLNALSAIGSKGINITIPHKTKAIKYCNQLSEVAKKIGAINTLIPHKEGGWLGDNTDVQGFIAPLKYKKNWIDKNALVMGCGGSAKAVIEGLKTLNLKKITIINRNQSSLENFLNSLTNKNSQTKIESLLSKSTMLIESIKHADLIVNTTPVGMKKNTIDTNSNDQIPLGENIWKNLKPGCTLYDLIYNPKPTRWLKIGLEKDCEIIDGLEMLIQQGAASLRLWSGINEIPTDLMREAAINHLI